MLTYVLCVFEVNNIWACKTLRIEYGFNPSQPFEQICACLLLDRYLLMVLATFMVKTYRLVKTEMYITVYWTYDQCDTRSLMLTKLNKILPGTFFPNPS